MVGKREKKRVTVYRILSRYHCGVAKVIDVERLLKRNDRGENIGLKGQQQMCVCVCMRTTLRDDNESMVEKKPDFFLRFRYTYIIFFRIFPYFRNRSAWSIVDVLSNYCPTRVIYNWRFIIIMYFFFNNNNSLFNPPIPNEPSAPRRQP